MQLWCSNRHKPCLEEEKPTEENITCEDQNGISSGITHYLWVLAHVSKLVEWLAHWFMWESVLPIRSSVCPNVHVHTSPFPE